MDLVRDGVLRRQQQVEQKLGALSYQVLKLLDEIKALEREFASLDATRKDLDAEEAIAKAQDLKPDQEAEKKA
jgi:hypothetical protein